MEKMIGVINNNLRSVISGIKEHRSSLESSLESIKKDMSLKIKEANSYKCDVENARLIISELENEISELENDLNELNEKFGAKDFKEILMAGNKEINAKIIEKRASITEQGQNIIELTEKAHVLKEDLVVLRDKKVSTEETLEKTKVLESYFETRITDIILFSEEHPNELSSYKKEEPQEELNVQENIDISSVIDGSIFEEIDEISSGEPNDELINEVLSNPVDEIDNEEDDSDNVSKQEEDEIDLTMTDQLENMISEAKSIIERNSTIINETKREEVLVEEPKQEEIGTVPSEETIDISSIDAEDDIEVIDIFVEEDDDEINPEYIISGEKKHPHIVLHEMSEPIEDMNESIDLQESEEDEIVENIIPEENDVVADENISSESLFNVEQNININEELKECGIDPDSFKEEDLVLLQGSFDKNNVTEFINVLKKYDINVNNIYKNVEVLINITPQNLDIILSLLKGTGAKNEDIDYVFDKLDKVNINKLEQNCLSSVSPQLTEVLLTALPYEESDIFIRLNFSPKDEETFKKSATETDLKIFNLFPDIIMTNYERLKGFKINNLDECITKHPHRFILNPTSFFAVLDKYDPEDLVRCINKNSAVLDRL